MPRTRTFASPTGALAGAALVALVLSGCVPNSAKAEAEAIGVTLKDDTCTVSANTAPSGPITFQVSNTGTTVNEFEVLAEDKLRIAGEKENIGPGTTVNYVVQLSEGSYFTACKPGMTGSPSHFAPFTVTKSAAKPGTASESAQSTQAAKEYLAYVKDQTAQLVTTTTAFVSAYTSGDDATARAQYPAARAYYERIEPTAEQFGDMDPALDLREADVETGLAWTGWHRIEKDLWPPAGDAALDAAARAQLGRQLSADTQRLHDLVDDKNFSLTIDQISNGAIGLMEEVARTKITGEEETFSHTDLWDFQANVEGAEVAYGTVRDIANGKGPQAKQVVRTLDSEFSGIAAMLAKYRSGQGFVSYTELTTAQVKELSDAVNALSEPLSRLTSIVVG